MSLVGPGHRPGKPLLFSISVLGSFMTTVSHVKCKRRMETFDIVDFVYLGLLVLE